MTITVDQLKSVYESGQVQTLTEADAEFLAGLPRGTIAKTPALRDAFRRGRLQAQAVAMTAMLTAAANGDAKAARDFLSFCPDPPDPED